MIWKLYQYLKQFYILGTMEKTCSKNRELEDGITLIITSCGRYPYLRAMLCSLFPNVNGAYLKYIYIIDDFPNEEGTRNYISMMVDIDCWDLKIFNKQNLGLGASLNKIYSKVKTKYVLHCEDDWIIRHQIPLNNIIDMLDVHQDVGQVMLNHSGLKNKKFPFKGEYKEYPWCYGFGIHVGKTQVYQECQPFSKIKPELVYTLRARKKGWRTLVLDDKIYIEHIGEKKKVNRR